MRTLFDFSISPGLIDKLFDLFAGLPNSNFIVAEFYILKYTEKDLQKIFKTILDIWTLTNFERPWDKPLKAWFQIYIILNPIWNIITFVNNMRIILLPLKLKASNAYFLLYFFFKIKSTSDGNGTSGRMT